MPKRRSSTRSQRAVAAVRSLSRERFVDGSLAGAVPAAVRLATCLGRRDARIRLERTTWSQDRDHHDGATDVGMAAEPPVHRPAPVPQGHGRRRRHPRRDGQRRPGSRRWGTNGRGSDTVALLGRARTLRLGVARRRHGALPRPAHEDVDECRHDEEKEEKQLFHAITAPWSAAAAARHRARRSTHALPCRPARSSCGSSP